MVTVNLDVIDLITERELKLGIEQDLAKSDLKNLTDYGGKDLKALNTQN